jgi:hypothetical protein
MSRDDDGWKPGPPPLDAYGRFDCVFLGDLRWLVEHTPEDGWTYDLGEPFKAGMLQQVRWHFPIPSPPAPPLSESSDAPK